MNNKKWWQISHWVNREYLINTYIRSSSVYQVTESSIMVDGLDIVFDENIDEVTECDKLDILDFNVILHVLNKYCRFKLNDSVTWNKFQDLVPGIICNETLNTTDVIDRNCLRFLFNEEIYEYNGVHISRVLNLVRKEIERS